MSYVYGRGKEKTVALKSLDLEIGKGESVVIIGPSGCGKSSMLKLIAGLLVKYYCLPKEQRFRYRENAYDLWRRSYDAQVNSELFAQEAEDLWG